MATDKKKKEVKVQDLKPAKDAKGGVHIAGRQVAGHTVAGRQVAGRTIAGRTEQLTAAQRDQPPFGPTPHGGFTERSSPIPLVVR